VKFFCPAIALFYGWSGAGYPSFWDEKEIFGTEGIPGAFWWESPSGKRLLLWCNNHGCNGERDPMLPDLAPKLQSFEERGYPWSLMRWPVNGGSRDNSPYIDFYGPLREWNEKWAFPHLVSSTNAKFYESFRKLPLEDLPVHRGDMPGQDYPLGASSTALATAVNRSNHADTVRAEVLASMASALTSWKYPADTLRRAHEETLWHDEHTWGHHFPCGPTCVTGELEKAVHAHRGATLAHDVTQKAMARIADRIRLEQEGIHLVVFNPSPYARTDQVSAMLREIDNCGSSMLHVASEEPDRGGILKPVVLEDRWHVSPDLEFVRGNFKLVDAETQESVPFEVDELNSAMDPVPYAGQRIGIGNGMARYGFFEVPLGLKRDLRFIAKEVPPLGYRTYRLEACETPEEVMAQDIIVSSESVENAFYRISLDHDGRIVSIFDKVLEQELVDEDSDYPFGALIVRDIEGKETISRPTGRAALTRNALSVAIRLKHEVLGHPVIEQVLSLYSGVPRIEFGIGILKDPTPNLEVAVAFPFAVPKGKYLLDEPLHVADPCEDRLPGAYSNRLAPQDWLWVKNRLLGVLWASLDAPTISIGEYWPNRVSPAHCGTPAPYLHLPPQDAEGLEGGSIFSCICFNNMATNFSVNQSGHLYFRYVFKSCSPKLETGQAAAFGDEAVRPFSTLFTKHAGERVLETSQSLMHIENEAIRLVTLKQAEDGEGMILRLWNHTDAQVDTRIHFPGRQIESAHMCNVVEKTEDTGMPCEDDGIPVSIGAQAIQTLRLRLRI